ncbi:histidine kinase dimerization/phosphoacceptor domain -containing protein [uncultured Sphingomonas sp.]|uniref:histidine kinase dimerization/phosphoacceptor domain -containing protein n=1 Tax=uncultured Sphingomonas sp. TaxID=158754 RepID=UPI0025E75D1A|nr:histidine kinase dimerization/phosphoacceptor domain -containing protein [uncultured Sphingomonas sp.]
MKVPPISSPSPVRSPTGDMIAADPWRHLALVTAATERLMMADDPAVMLESLFALIRDELDLDVFFHFRRDGDATRLAASGGLTGEERQAAALLKIEGSACGQAMCERRALHLTGIQQSGEARTGFVRSLGIEVYLCMPMLHGDDLLGTLGFGRRAARPFAEEERRLLSLLCHYASLAQHRLRIEEAMRHGLEAQARLLAELNHRVRNALQVAIGLVSHEARQAADPDTRRALLRATERLQVLASAHRPLYATADPGLVDLSALFGDVIAQLRADGPEARIVADRQIALPIERAVAAALLLDAMMARAEGVPDIALTVTEESGGEEAGNEILRISFDAAGWGRIADLVERDRLVARLCHQLRATMASEDDGCLILVMPHDGGEHGHRQPRQ